MIKRLIPNFYSLGIQNTGQSIDELNEAISKYIDGEFYTSKFGTIRFDSMEVYRVDFGVGDWLIFDSTGHVSGIFLDNVTEKNYSFEDLNNG
jgi:hypothetical protein